MNRDEWRGDLVVLGNVEVKYRRSFKSDQVKIVEGIRQRKKKVRRLTKMRSDRNLKSAFSHWANLEVARVGSGGRHYAPQDLPLNPTT